MAVVLNIFILIGVGVMVVVIVSLIPIYFVIMLKAGRKEALLRKEGVTTEGEVVSWKRQRTLRGGTSPLAAFITYQYYADSPSQARQRFTRRENVWASLQAKYPKGARIRIRYMPSDPKICQIAETILGLLPDL